MATVLPAFIRAEYDQSSQGFRDFERNAALAADKAKDKFEQSFGEIQSVVQKALSVPRNAAGALDFDTGNLRRAADDAQALATATREVARAAEIAAKSTQDTSESTRLYVQAARAAATSAEQNSRELVAQALTYERLQKEIDQTASATQRLVAESSSYRIAQRGVTESTRAVRQATVQAGQQLQDIVISLQGGQRASTVLAQQLPQLAFAFQGVGGKVGAVATVLSGPWGVAVALAAGALGGLIDNLFATESASGKLVLALDVQANSYTVLKRAVDEYNESQRQTEELSYQAIKRSKELAEQNLRLAETQLAVARARFENQDVGSKGGLELRSAYGFQVSQVEAEIARLRGVLGNASDALGSKEIEAQIDPVIAITRKWDEQVRKVRQAYLELAATRKLTAQEEATRDAAILAVEKRKKAAIDEQRKAERAAKSTALPPVTLREVTDLISSQLGGRITSTTGGKHVKGSYHYSGQAVDFVPKGGMGALSKADIREAFGAAGIQLKELLGPGDKGHDDHFHAAFAKRRQSVEQVNDAIKRAEDAAKRAADQLQNGIDRAADSVERLRGRFDEAPRDIDVATAAITDLNRAIDEADAKLKAGGLTDAQKAVIQQTRDTALQTRDQLIPAFLKRPVEDRITSGERELQLQRLVLAGREDEADVLSLQFDVMRQLRVENEADLRTELEKRGITFERYQILLQQREEMIAMSRAQDRLDRAVLSTQSKLRELDRAYETIAQGVAGLPDDVLGSIKDIAGNLRKQVNEIIARRITDSLFGNLFARLEGEIRGKRPIDMATGNYVDSTVRASGALNQLTDSFLYASSIMRGTAANDNIASKLLNSGKMVDGIPTAGRLFGKAAGASYNPTDIVVTGERHTSEVVDQLKRLNKVTREGLGTDSPLTKKLGGFLKNAAEGAFIGQTASSLVFGNKGSAAGSAIGGALGKIAGEAIGKTLGGLGGKIAGPLGSIAGGLIGSALGSAIMGTKKGTATIGGSGGDLAIASYGGNSKKFQQAAGTGADSAISTINRIAEMLGANVNASAGSVSIGIRDGKYRVDTSGKGITKTKKGAIDFGEDAEAAIRAATMDLIKDGVLTGLKASTQRILQQGKDLDAAVQKALDFESVFSRLKEFNDPVGAALDALNKEFTRLKKIFAEAGASTSEYADLEKLYGIEREKAIKEAAARVTASLQSLYDDLTIGENGRSVRDRLSAAQSAYDPLKARVLAGDKTAYDDFANAAKSLLDIQRQFSGSQTPYFNLLDEITKITKDRIDFEKNIVSISEGRDSPFTSTGASNDNYAPVVSAIGEMNQTLINGFRALLLAGGGGGERGFYTNAFL
ncbi:MAG: phage tail length tape measure family protein [Sphingopyxis sp.]|uniref:phage tail length tape measure family protein n=1 Tax=Sphingopyxis sp. TaxID=1908224 RepID=UPI001A45AF01|nr:phage tail length tape measure family protein [Sphingopyxis sp.]MBL9070408.1 phage tail length tape measure family protein [Sphingopyxis sp.]